MLPRLFLKSSHFTEEEGNIGSLVIVMSSERQISQIHFF